MQIKSNQSAICTFIFAALNNTYVAVDLKCLFFCHQRNFYRMVLMIDFLQNRRNAFRRNSRWLGDIFDCLPTMAHRSTHPANEHFGATPPTK
jgi:hypothetical protein